MLHSKRSESQSQRARERQFAEAYTSPISLYKTLPWYDVASARVPLVLGPTSCTLPASHTRQAVLQAGTMNRLSRPYHIGGHDVGAPEPPRHGAAWQCHLAPDSVIRIARAAPRFGKICPAYVGRSQNRRLLLTYRRGQISQMLSW